MPRIFLTGATGFIGGDLLHLLQRVHPEYEISALIRSADKAKTVVQSYPRVRVVLGDLDDTKIIEEEARQSDVVIHTASNKHIESVRAIAAGLEGRWDAAYIQVSGASVLAGQEIDNGLYGEPSEKIYDDLDDAEDLRSIIRAYPSRRIVDNFVLDLASTSPKVAIVFPSIIFGTGRGPGNQRSIQIPQLSKSALKERQGLYVGRGLNRWTAIHVADLSRLFVSLAEHAFAKSDDILWGQNGLYFADSDEKCFKDIATQISAEAYKLGYADSPSSIRSITPEESDSLIPHGAVVLGTNARARASRARKLLGWQPTKGPIEEYIAEAVAVEASKI